MGNGSDPMMLLSCSASEAGSVAASTTIPCRDTLLGAGESKGTLSDFLSGDGGWVMR